MVTIDRDRYVVFKILLHDEVIEITELKKKIWLIYQQIYGLDGTSEAGLYFEEYDKEKKIGLVRCNSKSLSNLMITFALITAIDKAEILILPLFTTGLIGKAKKYISTLGSSNHNID